jgi:hypothetical protein
MMQAMMIIGGGLAGDAVISAAIRRAPAPARLAGLSVLPLGYVKAENLARVAAPPGKSSSRSSTRPPAPQPCGGMTVVCGLVPVAEAKPGACAPYSRTRSP